jgi:hypothetical protein
MMPVQHQVISSHPYEEPRWPPKPRAQGILLPTPYTVLFCFCDPDVYFLMGLGELAAG